MISIVIPLFTSSFALALTCAPVETLTGPGRAVVGPILKVNQVDDADRRDSRAYADENNSTKEEIETRYSPTGDLDCPHGDSQANVTLTGNTLTTSAHSVYRDGTCGKNNVAAQCKFTTTVDGKKEVYEVERLVDSGYQCGPSKGKTGTDWAILKLKKSVNPKIIPYDISPDATKALMDGSEVMTVGKSIDFKNPRTKEEIKHYGNCITKSFANFDLSERVKTNCDIDHRASGGGLLTRGPSPVLLGVSEQIANGGKDCPKTNASKKSGPFSECWSSAATLVRGDFQTALEEIKRSSGNPTLRRTDQVPSRPAADEGGVDL